ncbi:MAG: hypothetical protein AAGH72_06720 [Verrucomicrobiota bacterium]
MRQHFHLIRRFKDFLALHFRVGNTAGILRVQQDRPSEQQYNTDDMKLLIHEK